jgi:hypothetical protein
MSGFDNFVKKSACVTEYSARFVPLFSKIKQTRCFRDALAVAAQTNDLELEDYK